MPFRISSVHKICCSVFSVMVLYLCHGLDDCVSIWGFMLGIYLILGVSAGVIRHPPPSPTPTHPCLPLPTYLGVIISILWSDWHMDILYMKSKSSSQTRPSEDAFSVAIYSEGSNCIVAWRSIVGFWGSCYLTTGRSSAQWASYQIRKIAGCACAGNAGNVSPRRRFQRKPLVSDPGMHHGTCVTHVPWCMSGSLTCGDGENVPGIPGACAPAILRI